MQLFVGCTGMKLHSLRYQFTTVHVHLWHLIYLSMCYCAIKKLLTRSFICLTGVLLSSSVEKTLNLFSTVVHNISTLVVVSFLYNTCDDVEWQELNALLTPVTSSSSSLAEDLLSQLTWPADPVTSSDSGTASQGSWIKKEETPTSQKSESGKASSDTATGLSLPANLTLAMSAAQVVATCKGLGQFIDRTLDWLQLFLCSNWHE